jgi:hypothetical protein
MTRQVVAVRNFANAPKYIEVQCEVFQKLLWGARTKRMYAAHYKLSLRAGEVEHSYMHYYSVYS